MVKLVGIVRIGKDAELITDPSWASSLIKFSGVHSRSYTNKQGEKVDSSLWIEFEYWTKKENLVEYFKKGTVLYVEGEPKSSGWYNKQTEQVNTKLTCKLFSFEFVPAQPRKEDVTPVAAPDAKFEEAGEGDLPF